MAINKFVYGGETKFDLTGDTVTKDKVLSGFTFHGNDGESYTGTCTFDSDTTDATAQVAEILKDKTAYARGSKLTGTMPNNGSVNGSISTKAGTYTIPQGYHDGGGSVSISQTEQDKLIPSNIRSGVEILGVTGSMSGSESVKAQAKTVTPSTTQQIITPDSDYNYLSQVTVNAIPYTETPNSANGITVTIG